MRILMLAQFYPPIEGGEERAVRDLAMALARRGHHVAVATLWHAGLARLEQDGPVVVHRIRGTLQHLDWLFHDASGRQHAPPWPDPGIVNGLERLVARERPDVVHAHNWMVHSFLPLKNKSKARLILSLHDYSLACVQKRLMRRGMPCEGPSLVRCLDCATGHYGAFKGVPVTLGGLAGARALAAAVDRFVVVSEAVATGNGLADRGLPYQVIPNLWHPAPPSPNAVHAEHIRRLPAGDFILFVGDLSHDKGLTLLLDAYAGLPDPLPLVLIGRRCADTPTDFPTGVRWLGIWPHGAVQEAWRAATIAVAPPVWPEPFGLVALEAMAAGRALVATRTGGLADVVVHGQTGLLVPPGDVAALRQALRQLCDDAALRERLGLGGQSRVKAYAAEVIAPKVEALYAEALAADTPRTYGRADRRMVEGANQ